MPKISKQTAAKGGLMTAILGMIGNVVGIGIFFKNNTVFRLNDNNAIGVLVAWILSTFIVLSMAMSFAEIASGKTKNGKAGIGPWAETFCGHKFGRYAKLGYNLIFWPINTFAVMFFAGEALLNCFAPLLNGGFNNVSGYNFGRGTTAIVFAIGAGLFAIFMIANYIKFNSMGKVGKGLSFVKFAPIAIVVLVGIIFGSINGGGLWAANSANTVANVSASNATSAFSFIGVISCIPAILFSFEGYVAIDSFKNDLSDPEKQIPLGVVLGVVVIGALYLAVTVGCITAGKGDVYQLMQMFKDKSEIAYKALTMIMSIFIFTCLIGCVNGMARGGITSYQELCKDGVIFKGKALYNKKPGNQYFAGFVSFIIVVAIWWIILCIPSSIMNTDAIADGSSTSMIVCLYLIYGGIVLCAFANRFNHKVEVKKSKVFPVAAVIGMIACAFMIGYVAFYQFLIAPLASQIGGEVANDLCAAKSGWGMFVSCGEQSLGLVKYYNWDSHTYKYCLSNTATIAWFWGMTGFAAISPVINDALIKGFDKRNRQPLMWEAAKQGALK